MYLDELGEGVVGLEDGVDVGLCGLGAVVGVLAVRAQKLDGGQHEVVLVAGLPPRGLLLTEVVLELLVVVLAEELQQAQDLVDEPAGLLGVVKDQLLVDLLLDDQLHLHEELLALDTAHEALDDGLLDGCVPVLEHPDPPLH